MTEGLCPSCGAPVHFTAGSALVLVCEHCNTVVGRSGKALENLGRVAAIVETDTPFQLGVEGRLGDQGFRIVGHLQKDQGAGLWDEWALELDSGDTAWLSESEGALHFLRYIEYREGEELKALRPGATVSVVNKRFVVEERGLAQTVAAAGQLPSDVDPGVDHRFVDLTGPQGRFATFDFGQRGKGAEVYVGTRVSLTDLNIAPDALRPRRRKAALVQARCTECNGPLELRAPDRTRRVACPYCGALLDASHGKLAFLKALGKPEIEPKIPLGAKGTLEGTAWTCIGFQRRFSTYEDIDYPWDEYLLYERTRGFAWLVESSGHWSFLEGVAAGDVTETTGRASYRGKTFRRFASAYATTAYVLGEFYWEVNQGDVAHGTDFVAPPRLLSREETKHELAYSEGRYVTPQEVKQAFNLPRLDPPRGVAPAQPDPYRGKLSSSWAWSFGYLLVLLVAYMLLSALRPEVEYFRDEVRLDASAGPSTPSNVRFTQPFEVTRRGPLKVRFVVDGLQNDWLGLELNLINEETGTLASVYGEAEFYSGRDVDGPWTEGSRSQTLHLSAVEPGRYVMRITPAFDRPAPRTYQVFVYGASPRLLWLLIAALLLFAYPVWLMVRSSTFETERWSESSFQGGEA